jgi:hypothetical protein
MLLDGELEALASEGDRLLAYEKQQGAPVSGQNVTTNLNWRALLYLGRADELLAAVGELVQLNPGLEPPMKVGQRGWPRHT